jgi:hypothetical protein
MQKWGGLVKLLSLAPFGVAVILLVLVSMERIPIEVLFVALPILFVTGFVLNVVGSVLTGAPQLKRLAAALSGQLGPETGGRWSAANDGAVPASVGVLKVSVAGAGKAVVGDSYGRPARTSFVSVTTPDTPGTFLVTVVSVTVPQARGPVVAVRSANDPWALPAAALRPVTDVSVPGWDLSTSDAEAARAVLTPQARQALVTADRRIAAVVWTDGEVAALESGHRGGLGAASAALTTVGAVAGIAQ